MIEQFSTLSGWMIPFSRAMEIHGLSSEDALKECDINDQVLKDQESRFATDKFTDILNYCNQKLGRHDFSMEVAKQFHPGMFHVLGYAMMSSNTLKDALERIARYKRVLSNACRLDVLEEKDDLIFQMQVFIYPETNRKVLSEQAVETFMGTIVQFSRELVGQELTPKKVCLAYPKPEYDTQYLSDFFHCDIEFNTEHCSVIFDHEQSNIKLLGGNPLVTQAHEKLLNEFLSRVNKDDLSHVIINKICNVLPLGAPSQIDIASQLNMSLRNLQRKLHDQGTNYKEILESTRKKLTLNYIEQKHLSLSEIGYLVGFSNTSNFNRAFKRWTDQTPGEYRNKLLGLN